MFLLCLTLWHQRLWKRFKHAPSLPQSSQSIVVDPKEGARGSDSLPSLSVSQWKHFIAFFFNQYFSTCPFFPLCLAFTQFNKYQFQLSWERGIWEWRSPLISHWPGRVEPPERCGWWQEFHDGLTQEIPLQCHCKGSVQEVREWLWFWSNKSAHKKS